MSEDKADFQELIRQVREGSQEAAWDLIERYSSQILRIVRRRLPQQLRGEFDSQDFVQAAWASVFAHRSRLVQLEDGDDFVAFMATIARNKVHMQVRRRLRGPVRISAADDLPEEEASKRPSRTPDTRHASPSQIASAKERWFQLLKGQPDHYQRFIEMRYAGITYREIAERMGFDESTVRRAVRKIFREQSE